ncbi:hypothetical protein PN36_02830 [Candidatus Thiomargarita nelsonii]|uniref:Uncharacterized protein n=1 Tax=Candidatus Thiomargarita nelsonii TaxID=1003181 RepID=A0A0A6RPL5_9GAMM|nr:hypothetical protein PN36_02830 [Candidatus Thiomargarita nelsonii]
MSPQKKRKEKKDSASHEEKKRRSRRSYLQLKVNLSETTPTGAVILEALLSDDPKFFKRYGLGPKVTRANKLLWLAYLGITQGHAPGSESVTVVSSPNEVAPPIETPKIQETVTDYSPKETVPSEEPHFELEKLELKMTKASEHEQEEDALDEGALMAGLID